MEMGNQKGVYITSKLKYKNIYIPYFMERGNQKDNVTNGYKYPHLRPLLEITIRGFCSDFF